MSPSPVWLSSLGRHIGQPGSPELNKKKTKKKWVDGKHTDSWLPGNFVCSVTQPKFRWLSHCPEDLGLSPAFALPYLRRSNSFRVTASKKSSFLSDFKDESLRWKYGQGHGWKSMYSVQILRCLCFWYSQWSWSPLPSALHTRVILGVLQADSGRFCSSSLTCCFPALESP